MFVHLVARTFPGLKLFDDAETAWALWGALRGGAADVVAACLMPNHVHQIEESDDVDASRRSLASRLGAYSKQLGHRQLWQRLPIRRSSST